MASGPSDEIRSRQQVEPECDALQDRLAAVHEQLLQLASQA